MRYPWQTGDRSAPGLDAVVGEPAGASQTCRSLARALERIRTVERPHIIDLGPFSGSSAVYLAGLGARVTVVDFTPPPAAGAEPDSPPPPFRLDQPDATFDVVLAWEALDFTPRPRLGDVGAEIVRVLRPGGALLMFALGQTVEAGSPLARAARFRIVAEDAVERQPVDDLDWRRHAHPAREVERAIAPLSILGSHLQRNQTRETVAVKPRT